ncbi:rhamnose ABC transporter substrate-binding protein [Promicromonospora sp. NPDC050249]|uniref:rhamnose ABC transporter substrate-binding protein n=1 Tax=Promicromonospora sp. NPDC050249 TaxID=3154743 RepID=UPI0033F44D1A
MKFTSVLAAGTAAMLALGLTACGSSDGGGGGGGDDALTITVLPKNLGNPYFEASTAGAEEAAGELGATVEEVGPDAASPDAQVPFINTAAQQGVSALVVSANDPTAIGDALEEARSAGTKVVTFDSDTEPQFRDLFVNQASPEGIADKQLELVADQIGGEGEIAILSASANATNQNAWIALMEEKLASDYPDIELVETVYGDDDDQTSFDKTAALLQSHPDLKGIVSPTTVGIAAAARYVSTSEYKGKVAVTGLGTPNQMREYVEDGTVEAFALWNPTDLGYLATQAAAALAAGDITGEEGETFTAGRLGEFTVGANGEVLLGEPYVYDESNIEDFDF